ncbi:serine carboxypeptidase-like 45 [Vicia villosa]|uniref:serine carboxypeptidase-like 45 n=1 Tax=Vicia villosa TaxID=3911 RepID=UPI00273C22F6|nr:serine carboxypeptidase-like 45 [Vicia villosa]
MSPYLFSLLFALICLRVNSSVESVEEYKIVTLPYQPAVDFHQYSGYVTVDEHNGRNLFFYFVEAQVEPASKPLLLWINGGPICSTYGGGAFSGNGPFWPTSNGRLVKNTYSWNREANMLYLDSPAGFGFSYSENASDYFTNDKLTARDNLVFLTHWFNKFPQYRTNDFFITGENYAGHYAPQLAELILQSKVNINLKGIAIGNPLLKFETDFNSATEFLMSHGPISKKTYHMLNNVCNMATLKRQIQSGNFSTNCSKVNLQLSKDLAYTDPFDVSAEFCPQPPEQQAYMLTKQQAGENLDVCVGDETTTYMNRKDVQNAMHAKLVGVKSWSSCSGIVVYDIQSLENSTISILGTLVKSGVRVLVYSGAQDSVIPFLGTQSLIDQLAEDFGFNTTKPDKVWFVGRQVAGSTMEYDDILTYATVIGAGHSVPFSQPERALKLIQTFLKGKSLQNEL